MTNEYDDDDDDMPNYYFYDSTMIRVFLLEVHKIKQCLMER